nr:hypothetical protein [Pseudomonas mediterranea]
MTYPDIPAQDRRQPRFAAAIAHHHPWTVEDVITANDRDVVGQHRMVTYGDVTVQVAPRSNITVISQRHFSREDEKPPT